MDSLADGGRVTKQANKFGTAEVRAQKRFLCTGRWWQWGSMWLYGGCSRVYTSPANNPLTMSQWAWARRTCRSPMMKTLARSACSQGMYSAAPCCFQMTLAGRGSYRVLFERLPGWAGTKGQPRVCSQRHRVSLHCTAKMPLRPNIGLCQSPIGYLWC